MLPLISGMIARVLLGALAGFLATRGYDTAEQQKAIEPIANALASLVCAVATVAWGLIARRRTVTRAVEATKRATLDEPELTAAILPLPAAKGRIVVSDGVMLATADPLAAKPSAAKVRPVVTVAKLNELIAAERKGNGSRPTYSPPSAPPAPPPRKD